MARQWREIDLPMRWIIWLGAAVALARAVTADAAELAGLYEAAVEVPDRTSATVRAGYSDALERVLIRVTGQRTIEQGDGAHELLGVARNYVQQYRFLDDGSLWVRFDEEAVNAALAARGVGLWGAQRPETLMWLALDNGRGERAMLGAEDVGDIPDLLREHAALRGLPLLLPLNDSVDMQTLTFADVWAGFDEKVVEASERYGANAILVGRAELEQNRRWRVRWTLLMGATQAQAIGGLESGIDLAADRFAELFAVRGSTDGNEVVVMVSGMESFAEYGAVARYLEQLSVVERVSTDELSVAGVRFRLGLRADTEMLQRTIALGSILESEVASEGSADPGTGRQLSYRYRR